MAIMAVFLENERHGLLLPLLSAELRGLSCVQRLVHLVDEGLRMPSCTPSVLQAC